MFAKKPINPSIFSAETRFFQIRLPDRYAFREVLFWGKRIINTLFKTFSEFCDTILTGYYQDVSTRDSALHNSDS